MKTKLRKSYNIIIRAFIIIMTFWFLYDQLFHSNDIQTVIDFFPKVTGSPGFAFKISALLVLLFVNYLLESYKWKYFIAKLEKVSLLTSYKAILTGISVSMFMPNRSGDYLGRVFILKKADRIQAILATILGTMSQLIATIIFGSIASIIAFPTVFNLEENLNSWLFAGLITVVIISLFTIVFAYLNFSVFSGIIKRISGRGYRKIKKYAEVFTLYSVRDLLFVLIISLMRYIIFSFQFVLLLWLFRIDIPYLNAMVLISLVYLGVTVIPTIALTEIGVRGSVSVFIFTYYYELMGVVNPNIELGVASASTVLWFVNLVIPAFIGAFFVFNLKFFRKTETNG
ncbi:MAG: hypothetical protein C0598_12510 [Marinilabiliales bacterium]|nr:MAG: hypothetical protein C0598_12510 [Marinilabiliales bacterium]